MADAPQTTVVEFQIRPENNTMDEWVAEWDLRARDAADHEPETTAYAAAVNIEDPDNVLIFERYSHGDTSLKTHMDRPAHAALMAAMQERNMTRRVVWSASFPDIDDYGWWARREKAPQRLANDIVLVMLGLRFENDDHRRQFIEMSAGHAEYCAREEPDTLVYSGGIATQDVDREVQIQSGDLIFAMACSDMAAVEKHAQDPHHLALGERLNEAGINPTPTFMRTYRTVGNGYLWR